MFKYIKGALIWLAALIAILFVQKIYKPYDIVDDSVEQALDIRPGFAKALTLKNNILIQKQGQSASAEVQENVRKILKQDPLNDEVIIQYGLVKPEADTHTISDFLNLAKTRNGRNLKASSYILIEKVKAGNFDGVVREINLLFKLYPEGRGEFDTLLDQLWQTPQGKLAIISMLESSPGWDEAFIFRVLNKMNASNAKEPAILLRSFIGSEDQKRRMLSVYIKQLLSFDEFEFAQSIWNVDRAERSDNGSEPDNLIYNPNFQDLAVVPGFDWSFQDSKNSSIEYMQTPGLFVGFKLNKAEKITEQIVEVPKDVNLQFDYSLTYLGTRRGGILEWRVYCAENNTRLATLEAPYAEDREEQTIGSAEFPVGQCRYLSVELWASPGRLSRRVSANVTHVSLKQTES